MKAIALKNAMGRIKGQVYELTQAEFDFQSQGGALALYVEPDEQPKTIEQIESEIKETDNGLPKTPPCKKKTTTRKRKTTKKAE